MNFMCFLNVLSITVLTRHDCPPLSQLLMFLRQGWAIYMGRLIFWCKKNQNWTKIELTVAIRKNIFYLDISQYSPSQIPTLFVFFFIESANIT